ncbi:MAG: glycosyltransferase family 2 protein [Candidatus Aenigmatarchaeota archaeon]
MEEGAFPKRIDAVMLTKNSEEILEKCLDSLFQNVPVNRLIVVDGFSQDRTLDILEKYKNEYSNIRIIQDDGTRATARQKGIEAVKTDWFMFIDSDVVLCKDWFKRATNYIKEDTGIVWGVNIDVIPGLKSETFLKLWKKVAIEAFKIRGGMHDTLIRYDAVKDIKIPEDLHFYEDFYITAFILNKGYKAIIGNDLYCLHFRPQTDWNLKESIKLASAEIRYGLIRFHLFKYAFYFPFFSFYWFLQRLKKGSSYD